MTDGFGGTGSLGQASGEITLDASGALASLNHLKDGLQDVGRQAATMGDNLRSGLQAFQANLDAMGASLRNVGKDLTARVSLPIVAVGGVMVNWASDLDESINKVDVLFDDAADSVMTFSKTAATSLGISQQSALDFSSSFAGMLKPIAENSDELANMSTRMTQLAADFGSFNNLSPEQSFTVISSALAGETEAIRRFGVDVSAAAVEQKALEEGLAGTASELTEQDKLYARYLLILEQTTDAQGDFAKTADSTSNRLKTMRARLQDVGSGFGRILLPFVDSAISGLMRLLGWVENLSAAQKRWVVGIAAMAAALGPLLIGIGLMLPALGAIAGALAFLVSPVGLIIVGIAALAAGLIYAYTHFEGFRKAVDSVLKPIGDAIDKFREFVGLLFDVPETKAIGVTLNTSLDDPEDAWSNWVQMPDGSWKNATLGITSQALDATVTEMLDPDTGEKSWNLNVDIDGDGSADALKIIDSVDQGGGKFVMTVEVDGKKYEAWYDENTGQTIIVPMEVEITNEGEINEKLNKLSRRETFEIWLKVINGDILDRLQDKSDALLVKIQGMADAFGDFIGGLTFADIPGLSSFSEAVNGIKNDWEDIKGLITWVQNAFSNGFGSESLTDEQEDVQYGGQGGGGTNIGTAGGGGTGAQGGPTRFGSMGAGYAAGAALAGSALDALVGAAERAGTAVATFATNAAASFANTGKAAQAGLQPIPPLAGQVAATLLATAVPAFIQLATTGVAQFTSLQSAAQGRFTAMQATILSTTAAAASGARGQIAGMASSVIGQVGSMAGTVQGRFSGLQGSVSGSMAAMASAAASGASRMASALASGANQAVGAVRSALSAIPGIIAAIGGSAAATAYSAGANISQSFASGMYSALGAIQAAAAAMVAAADQAVRAKAMIHSPSKLAQFWADMIGVGFVDRLESYAGAARSAARSLITSPAMPSTAGAMIPALAYATPAAMYTAPVSSPVYSDHRQYNIEVNGADDPERVARIVIGHMEQDYDRMDGIVKMTH